MKDYNGEARININDINFDENNYYGYKNKKKGNIEGKFYVMFPKIEKVLLINHNNNNQKHFLKHSALLSCFTMNFQIG